MQIFEVMLLVINRRYKREGLLNTHDGVLILIKKLL